MTYVAQNRPARLCLTGWVSPERAGELVAANEGAISIDAPSYAAAYRIARSTLRPEWDTPRRQAPRPAAADERQDAAPMTPAGDHVGDRENGL